MDRHEQWGCRLRDRVGDLAARACGERVCSCCVDDGSRGLADSVTIINGLAIEMSLDLYPSVVVL